MSGVAPFDLDTLGWVTMGQWVTRGQWDNGSMGHDGSWLRDP